MADVAGDRNFFISIPEILPMRTVPVLTSILIMFSIQANAQTDACQAQLSQSIDKVFSSGPVRIVQTIHVNSKPNTEIVTLFVPPRDTQVDTRTLLTGEDLRKHKAVLDAMVKANPSLFPDGPVVNTSIVHVGDDIYFNGKKNAELMSLNAYRKNEKASELSELNKIVDRSSYYALTCDKSRIDFDIDSYVAILSDEIEEKKMNAQQIDAERKKKRAADNAASKTATKPLRASLELDAQGRPVRMTRQEEVPDAASADMAMRMFPGLEMPKITSLDTTVTFTYDASIRITAPR